MASSNSAVVSPSSAKIAAVVTPSVSMYLRRSSEAPAVERRPARKGPIEVLKLRETELRRRRTLTHHLHKNRKRERGSLSHSISHFRMRGGSGGCDSARRRACAVSSSEAAGALASGFAVEAAAAHSGKHLRHTSCEPSSWARNNLAKNRMPTRSVPSTARAGEPTPRGL